MPDSRSLTHAAPMIDTARIRVSRRLGRIVAVGAALVAVVAWSASPALAADPRTFGLPGSTTIVTPTQRIRTVDLSRTSAAVEQYTSYWCVPAATQTMLNLVTGRSDRSYATQSRLYTELRRSNLYRYATNGNDVRGWSRVLTAHLPDGMGYADRSFSSRAAAYKAIVSSMDRTKRPVGIVVDKGTHAWTVVGFKVSEVPGDPTKTVILGFYVVGPLGSPSDPWPKKYVTADQLATRYTRYHEWQRTVPWEGLYVIVAPLSRTGAVTATR